MKYSPLDILRKFVLRKCIEHLVVTSEQPIWVNITFWENVTEKPYAAKCWDRLKHALVRQYPGIRLVGIWARQGRGAWHIHAVADRRIDVNWLRTKAMRAGFGPQMYLRELDGKQETPEKIARYICGYCTDKNALDPVRDKGVRRMIFVGKHVRVLNMRYKSSLKRVTSLGRQEAKQISDDEYAAQTDFERDFSRPGWRKKAWETWGDWYRRNREYWFQIGWESLSEEEQGEMLLLDDYTSRYFETGRWSYV